MGIYAYMYWYTGILIIAHLKSSACNLYYTAGKDLGQEEKGMTEDEMAGWQSVMLTRWTWVWVNSGSW